MWFDVQAALKHLDGAEMPRSNSAPPAEPQTPRVANVAGVAGVQAEIPKTPPSAKPPKTAFPYGASAGGRPLTYTGRVVSLEAWRNLTEWERHGPRGRLWCGVNRRWETKRKRHDEKD
ncbi:hypothetical protein SAMN05444398_11932 [Roseovarius pacificus]|uniref:Uncharacterized protein n=1 Tax=Roseovarius pacificus TaxID=337701 RepID=A0A1M7JC52_9RHOB|nr:hypothetical protein [Roseovarius pacificus]GGO61965.1 hypothetical protein GCM10011315_39850 [Roseovarius pacificus]SHM50592.1 hypothetical protein SAMN05444398_11932 [Roseovarius pacificus]